MLYFTLKFLHLIGAAVLLGTGAGIAFFMVMAHRTGEAVQVAAVARIVVTADFVFTATAVIAQPATGAALALKAGYPLTDGWILVSILLYVLAGCFWLPVVWMQMHMRDLAQAAAAKGLPLPKSYHRLFWTWFGFGFPAFASVLAIFWLMIARPAFRFFV
jgi:uncharacterized membrane protein